MVGNEKIFPPFYEYQKLITNIDDYEYTKHIGFIQNLTSPSGLYIVFSVVLAAFHFLQGFDSWRKKSTRYDWEKVPEGKKKPTFFHMVPTELFYKRYFQIKDRMGVKSYPKLYRIALFMIYDRMRTVLNKRQPDAQAVMFTGIPFYHIEVRLFFFKS